MPKRRFCLLLSLFLLAGLPALAEDAPIRVTQGWARATPGASTIGAAYLTIESNVDDRLLAAATPIAADAQLHQHLVEDGTMVMRQLDGVDVHAGQKLVFEPDGMHIMLIGLKQKLAAGESFPLILTFRKSGTVETQIAVRPLGGGHDHGG